MNEFYEGQSFYTVYSGNGGSENCSFMTRRLSYWMSRYYLSRGYWLNGYNRHSEYSEYASNW